MLQGGPHGAPAPTTAPAGGRLPRVRPRHRRLHRRRRRRRNRQLEHGHQAGRTLSYAADQEPTGFNNNTSKDNGTSVLNVVINMFPPVFRLHPDYSVRLNQELMDSATQTSADPQTIVYTLKPNAVWSDGTPVSADDFVYLWKNLDGSIEGNDVASTTGYDQIQSVEGSEEGKTVTVVFKEPFTDWKSLFYGLLPAHYMAKVPGGWNTGLDKHPESIPVNGPYRIAGWDQFQSLTLSRNDQYFGPKTHLDSIVFRFLPESTTQPAALQNNEVDLIYPQPQLDLVTQVKALPDVTSELNIGLSFEHLDFNFKNPLLADINVRKAIATGLDLTEVVNRTVKQFTDQAQPLGNRIWLPGQKYYQDHFGQYGKGDLAAATKLLEDAGYARGGDGVYAKDGKRLSFRISTTASRSSTPTTASCSGSGCPTATSTSPTSAGSATPSPSPPARTSTAATAAATTAGTPAGRSTTCSPRRSGRSTRPSRPSSATRSTSSSPPTWPPSRCTPSRASRAAGAPLGETPEPGRGLAGGSSGGIPDGGRAGQVAGWLLETPPSSRSPRWTRTARRRPCSSPSGCARCTGPAASRSRPWPASTWRCGGASWWR
jgi:ABC-type transport system substrate-binding protein